MSASDSKSFKHVYGDVELHKDECINHIAKQPGAILHKVAAPGQKGGVPLGAQGFGQLIKTTMGRLEEFYYLAVRGDTGNFDKMYDAVWASLCHASSTYEKPRHDHCPVGADSWCFYQKALSTGQKPGKQNTAPTSTHCCCLR